EALQEVSVPRGIALAMVVSQHLIQYIVVGVPGAFLFFSKMGGKIELEQEELEKEANEQALELVDDASVKIPVTAASCALSIIIPAYNEEARLGKTINEIENYFSEKALDFEVIVVDDGSSDKTAALINEINKRNPKIKFLTYPRNRGKGYAVRFGVLNAQGEQILFADADGATPIAEYARLEKEIARGSDIAIGSRAMQSTDTGVKTVWYRKFIGRIFNSLVNIIVLPGIADTQCGFKLFKRKVAYHVFSKQLSEKFSFDVEILFIARKSKYKISEIPVNWVNQPGSKVNLIKDSFAMAVDLLRFRIRDLFGKYAL
ncbi:MAG: glycosyltransferase family 2 protein, partial [Proteobacteria bacterium]|nr:glycosyltransferase family 2 protein [Pseudomonadota bacterium]